MGRSSPSSLSAGVKKIPEFPWHPLWRLQPHVTRYLILQKWLEFTSLKWTKKLTTITLFGGDIHYGSPKPCLHSWVADPRIFWNFCFGTWHSPGQSVVANPKSQAEFLSFFHAKRLTLKQISLRYSRYDMIWLQIERERYFHLFLRHVHEVSNQIFLQLQKSKAVANWEFARNQSSPKYLACVANKVKI